jgi:uncharacterized protein YxjI
MSDTKLPLKYMSAGLALAIAASILSECKITPSGSDSPDCASAPEFLAAQDFTIKEHILELTPTYDLIAGNNCDVGTMTRKILTFTRETDITADGSDLGRIETKIISLGTDMTVYDANGNVVSTVDHKLLDSALNFGGYYIEISDPSGQILGTLKQDPFSIWTQAAWRYFDVTSPDGKVAATIEYTALIPDTYHVVNHSTIDNRTLAGVVSILDQLQDEATSSHSNDD